MNASIIYEEVKIKIGSIVLKGNLRITENSEGIVLFSHGSGSSRLSRRNNYVADFLFYQGISSLLFDLLTEEEDSSYESRFDIDLLADRLVQVTHWVLEQTELQNLPIAFFGASTGAASALQATASLDDVVQAVVSRGGRPDLALSHLQKVDAPTLLIVGENDTMVIDLNKKAQARLAGPSQLIVVPGASHLFEEPGKLQIVAKLASDWFHKYLKKSKN